MDVQIQNQRRTDTLAKHVTSHLLVITIEHQLEKDTSPKISG
jgi:hypothetical protein